MAMPDAHQNAAIELRAGCKINLFLRIICRRTDGYHELETLFVPLPEPSDTLLVHRRTDMAGIRFTCSRPTLEGQSNLVVKAYEAYSRRTGFAPALHVHLDKRIPMGAGLGGGSADAAALLTFLNAAAGSQGLAMDDLSALGAKLGADVPYFLRHGLRGESALATGIGEALTQARTDLDGYSLVLVCPDEHVSTPWAYGQWDRLYPEKTCPPACRPVLTAIDGEASNTFCPETTVLANDFEEVVFPEFPRLAEIKGELLDRGAAHAVMSGSGAAIFALYRDSAAARDACAAFVRRSVAAYEFHFPRWGVAKW